MHIIGHALGQFAEIGRISHEPAEVDIVAVGINHRETELTGQLRDQGAVRQKAAAFIDEDGVELRLRLLGEGAATLIAGRKLPVSAIPICCAVSR